MRSLIADLRSSSSEASSRWPGTVGAEQQAKHSMHWPSHCPHVQEELYKGKMTDSITLCKLQSLLTSSDLHLANDQRYKDFKRHHNNLCFSTRQTCSQPRVVRLAGTQKSISSNPSSSRDIWSRVPNKREDPQLLFQIHGIPEELQWPISDQTGRGTNAPSHFKNPADGYMQPLQHTQLWTALAHPCKQKLHGCSPRVAIGVSLVFLPLMQLCEHCHST